MDKRRPIGVVIISVVGIIVGISTLLVHIYEVYDFLKGTYILVKQSASHFFFKKIIGIIFGICTIASSIYVLKLKKWARKLFICLTLLNLLSVLVSMVIIVTILPYANYGIFRMIGGFIVEFSSSFNFHYLSNFVFLLEYIPNRYIEYITWGDFFLSITLPVLFIYYLTRASIKRQFIKN